MQLTARLRNKSTAWVSTLRPRVGDVVVNAGVFYSNIAGYNDVLSNASVWFPIGNQSSSAGPITINKVNSNISGSDPFWYLDLSGDSMPPFPVTLQVYVDPNGDGNWVRQDPVDYNPVTHILSGMSSKTDFPNQKIKIVAS